MSHVHDSPENPHAGQGSVLLDIGGDVGALVVTMPLASVGSEVEILPHGEGRGHGDGHGHPPHVAVVRRSVPGGEAVPSLVFPDLVRGRYDLVEKGSDQVRLSVRISGGDVTTAVWPA